MALAWWRQLALKRMTRAAGRRQLSVESLEERTTPTGIFAVGATAGNAPVVTVFDAVTRQQKFTVTAFDGFTGGLNVAVGDVNGDGTADVIVGAGPGGGPVVDVFSGVDGSLIGSVTAGDSGSRAGTTVAAADIDGDGKADLVVGTIQNGQPAAQVIRFSDQKVLHSFTPFGDGSVAPSVATGDFNGDGTADVVMGAPSGDGSRVMVFDGSTEAVLFDKFAFEDSFLGGVQVSAGDMDGDGKAEVVAAAGNTGGPRVIAFAGGTGAVYMNFFAYDDSARTGVGASVADSDGKDVQDLVTVDGAGSASNLKAFGGNTLAALPTPSFNGLPAAASFDFIAPTATLVTTSPAATAGGSFAFTATFSEPVNGFSAAGLTVTNGSVANFAAVDAKTYTFDMTPSAANSPATVQIAGNAAADAAGNGNTASNSITRTTDTIGPTVTVNPLTTNDTTPTLTGTVSEAGSHVVVTVAGQTFSATLTGTNWSATLPVAIAEGTYDITATGTDPVGNTGSPTTLTGGLVVDTTAPTATLASSAPQPTKTSPIPFTVAFSEDVTGFVATDLTVVNGSVTNFVATDARNYSFGVVPTTQGIVTVTVPQGAAQDAAGNGNTASATVTRQFDNVAPAVTANPLTTNDQTPVLSGTIDDNGATISVTVSGNGQTPQTVTATQNGQTWTATFNTVLPEGTYDIAVTATDAAGNVGVANLTGGLVIDITPPTATIVGPASPTNADPIVYTVTFSEPVTGFDASDVNVQGGAVTSVVANSSTSYTVDVHPSSDGQVDVFIIAGGVSDTAGNTNPQSATNTLTSDRTAPVVTADPLTTNKTTPTLTGTVDDPNAHVTVVVGGQTIQATVSGTTWSADVTTALTDGTYDVSVSATDAAGNVGTTPGTGALVIDTAAPSGNVDPTGNGAFTGTAADTGSGVSKVEVAVADHATGQYWDGSQFNSPTPDSVYAPATDTSAGGHFATWSFAFSPLGTYDVTIRVTDAAGNQTVITRIPVDLS
jgi:hypothetical protein